MSLALLLFSTFIPSSRKDYYHPNTEWKPLTLTTRSRLGCQVFLTKEVDGMVAKLPSATRNMYVDGTFFYSCIYGRRLTI